MAEPVKSQPLEERLLFAIYVGAGRRERLLGIHQDVRALEQRCEELERFVSAYDAAMETCGTMTRTECEACNRLLDARVALAAHGRGATSSSP